MCASERARGRARDKSPAVSRSRPVWTRLSSLLRLETPANASPPSLRSLPLEDSAARRAARLPIGAGRQAPAHTSQTMRSEAWEHRGGGRIQARQVRRPGTKLARKPALKMSQNTCYIYILCLPPPQAAHSIATKLMLCPVHTCSCPCLEYRSFRWDFILTLVNDDLFNHQHWSYSLQVVKCHKTNITGCCS